MLAVTSPLARAIDAAIVPVNGPPVGMIVAAPSGMDTLPYLSVVHVPRWQALMSKVP